MQALYWNGHDLRLESSRATPAIDQQNALVQVHLAGICDTDLQIFNGYMGFRGVPGHEFVGSVREGPT
jgi:threonine dehydrogenase-like Zn-dependent dehydrogenase